MNNTKSFCEFHIASHHLSWVSGAGATISLSHVHYMGVSHGQYHADMGHETLHNQWYLETHQRLVLSVGRNSSMLLGFRPHPPPISALVLWYKKNTGMDKVWNLSWKCGMNQISHAGRTWFNIWSVRYMDQAWFLLTMHKAECLGEVHFTRLGQVESMQSIHSAGAARAEVLLDLYYSRK